MLRGCYGNRPSCLAKDLPSEVGLTMKNRRKQKQKAKLSRIILLMMTSFYLHLSNVQSHDLSSLCNALSIEITFFPFFTRFPTWWTGLVSWKSSFGGEFDLVIYIFPITRWETIYHKTRSQVGWHDGDHWTDGWGGRAIVSLAQASSRWMSSENTRWTCWSQETQNIGYPGQSNFWLVLKRLTIRVYFKSIPAAS